MALIKQHPAGPALLAEPGVGPVVAAQLLISWSHHGRVRNEAAFASLAGAAPIETSSGQRSRHRLNRGGDRALNRRCTPSRSPACDATPNRSPTRSSEPRRARPTATSDALSSARSPAASTNELKRPSEQTRHPSQLDKHRSVQRPAAPVLPQRQRPVHPLRRGSRLGRARTQRPAPQTARVRQRSA